MKSEAGSFRINLYCSPDKTRVGKSKETTKEMTKEIKRLMKDAPAIRTDEIAKCLGVSAETVRYRIKIMKKAGEIERKGATKKGEWIVIERES
ncbi:MAG: HTH domain-containing protein [Lachnospiraceae bacterium]|nr:HTH domain-containing protein [Lachnospiraceae bacterium]MCM1240696.1 HTH domain-containing protein [Lachnospiraceae bacterium]